VILPHLVFPDDTFQDNTRWQGIRTEREGSLQFATQLLLIRQTLFTLFTKQVSLMRRSSVLSISLQLVFPGDGTLKLLTAIIVAES
jgi:hypothetical protein